MTDDTKKGILFYDGDCGLCNRAVRFLMKRDRANALRFAPIQGETGAKYLPPELRELLSTAIYRPPASDSQVDFQLRSEAVLCALIDTLSIWSGPARLARGIPLRWRDKLYNWVARNRHRLFKKSPCGLPTNAERKKLLP